MCGVCVQSEDAILKLEDISMAIVTDVEQRCQCGFTSNHITNKVFQCFDASPQAVTYRAALHGTVNIISLELISQIDHWISGGSAVSVQNILIRVDSSCMVTASSYSDDECTLTSHTVGIQLVGSVTAAAAGVCMLYIGEKKVNQADHSQVH